MKQFSEFLSTINPAEIREDVFAKLEELNMCEKDKECIGYMCYDMLLTMFEKYHIWLTS